MIRKLILALGATAAIGAAALAPTTASAIGGTALASPSSLVASAGASATAPTYARRSDCYVRAEAHRRHAARPARAPHHWSATKRADPWTER